MYTTATPTDTPSIPTATVVPVPTEGPTATPLAHIVERNDTLLGIALEYGVSLEELLAANPGINPRALSIGQSVLIPGPEGEPIVSLAATPTPLPVSLSEPVCYAALSGGMWCLVIATNPQSSPIEGVVALITLLDGSGRSQATEPAFSPIRLLPPGEPVPLAAYFAPPAPSHTQVVATLLSAVDGGEASAEILPIVLARAAHTPGADGLSWSVRGSLSLAQEAPTRAGRAVLLLVAFAADGRPVGFAQWEADESLDPGEEASFEITVYSLGPTIDHVELLAEAMAE
jgi:LysM repeat protein